MVNDILLNIKITYFMHIQEVINTFNIVFNTPNFIGVQGFFELFDKNCRIARIKSRLKEYNGYKFT